MSFQSTEFNKILEDMVNSYELLVESRNAREDAISQTKAVAIVSEKGTNNYQVRKIRTGKKKAVDSAEAQLISHGDALLEYLTNNDISATFQQEKNDGFNAYTGRVSIADYVTTKESQQSAITLLRLLDKLAGADTEGLELYESLAKVVSENNSNRSVYLDQKFSNIETSSPSELKV